MTPYSDWDEFQWEEEIRRHEHRVAELFKNLVFSLDLPIADFPGMTDPAASAPADSITTAHNEAGMKWMIEHELDDEDDYREEDDGPRHPVCFSCVDALNHLAVMWNQFTVTHCCNELFLPALAINCAFGKLLARCADFTEPADRSSDEALLISLGKRTLADLSDLTGRIDKMAENLPEREQDFRFFRSRLALLHDQLAEHLNSMRRDDPPF
ncbi:MAG: hypothetical protein IKC82_04980 [Lentisphaeria bacterium]|nr:hypothetical protein [Lentisphaeria bacterium]